MNSFRHLWFAGLMLFGISVHAERLSPIFDGKTFNGWEQRGEAVFEIQDGTIVGRTGKGGHGWLCTKRTYGDFVLELEVKIQSGNSGVQIRSHFENGDKMVGYQIEVDASPRAWSGGLYEQGRRGWLQNLERNDAARAAFKTNDWNHYRIVCIGDSIKSWVNGVPAADYRDSMDVEGVIALQVHSGKNARVSFRNIRLQDLGRHAWQPIWDGKSFSGWHEIGVGKWEIVDGAIRGTHEKAEKQFGHLVSDQKFADFTVRLTYKAVTGNSGLYFRIDESGRTGVAGFQAEIDAKQDAGGLYETDGRAWVVKPKPEDVEKWFKPQEWNTMTVSAHGRRIAVDVNGFRTAELLDDPGRTEGHLALQLHGNQDCEIYFKDIEILKKDTARHSALHRSLRNAEPVSITTPGNKLRVEIGGNLFTEYHFKDVPRPFYYPVIGPGELPITRNWPMQEVENEQRDHPHHRSLWFTHGNVNGIDFWSENKEFGRIVHDRFLQVKSGADFGVIQSANKWVSAAGKVICTDTRTMRIYGQTRPRLFDFEITLHASEGDVTLGDTKEGTMALRLAETMRLKPNSFNVGKPTGAIVLSTGIKNAETWGKRAAWCDYHGPVNGTILGAAIFDHPSNPRHPTWWHVRDYGLFAANPFGVHDFEQKPAGSGDFLIPSGESATFRYRFVLHEGDEKQARIAELYEEYSAERPHMREPVPIRASRLLPSPLPVAPQAPRALPVRPSRPELKTQ